jgi:glycosyltransferase involved in cell wall biosynthesis
MKIGIDASRAFIKDRTGIEEYSYQVIKHLTDRLGEHEARLASTSGHLRESRRVVLYLRKNQKINFALPGNWKIKVINFPYLWTQIGLSLEMLFHPVDTLFVSAHAVPVIHPKNTVAVIHGLEYEFCPQAYSFWERLYMRWSIKFSCQWAKKIIAVSENTKKDLLNLYKVPEEKIEVIYEGVSICHPELVSGSQEMLKHDSHAASRGVQHDNSKYLLFIGRLEERKNIVNIINAFEILKEQYKLPHKLVLAGKPGFGWEKIKDKITNANCTEDIVELGFVSEEEKWNLLKDADVFVFPTLYEGFGLPILEAQSAGTPVVAANNSSIPEVINCHSERSVSEAEESGLKSFNYTRDDKCSALLVNPNNAEEIADAVYKIISDEKLKNDIINKAHENIKRFSWERCANQVAEILRVKNNG